MQLLAYLHGDAPLGRWGWSLKENQTCTIFGPRGSLELGTLERPALLFGDETSLGLAHALRFTPGGARTVDIVLEVTSKPAVVPVLERMGLSHAHVVERTSDESHLREVEELLARLRQAHAVESVVLTGKASSIQRLNKHLRSLGLSAARVRKRAYWATGKVGLD
jgi:NADPH-dependent ferric siderophore reductase